MNTLRNTLHAAMLLLATITLTTACDDDAIIGSTLTRVEGRWFGDMDMYVDGMKARGTDIQFVPQNFSSTRGYGIQYDYYGHYGALTVSHKFDWEVVNSIIYLYYDDPGLDCSIRDYRLTTNQFSGWIDGIETSTPFKLYSYDIYWDEMGYSAYDYVYDQYWSGGYYRANTRTQSPEPEGPKCTRGVNMKQKAE